MLAKSEEPRNVFHLLEPSHVVSKELSPGAMEEPCETGTHAAGTLAK